MSERGGLAAWRLRYGVKHDHVSVSGGGGGGSSGGDSNSDQQPPPLALSLYMSLCLAASLSVWRVSYLALTSVDEISPSSSIMRMAVMASCGGSPYAGSKNEGMSKSKYATPFVPSRALVILRRRMRSRGSQNLLVG